YFFLMLCPPPKSSLFPYTTLFRSHDRGVSDFAALKEDFIDITDGRSAALPDELHDFELLRGKRVVFGTHSKYLVLINSYVKGKRDRKSTRLNSSHVAISYAVFCLK